jgi:peptidyl-prolyl cis-trans isomerase-like 3
LNNQNTIIAQVIDGFDVLDAIERTPVVKKNRPVSDIIIERIIIHANPLAT